MEYTDTLDIAQAFEPWEQTYNEGSGSEVTTDGAVGRKLTTLTVHGASVQDGTPTPDAPVEVKSVSAPNLSPFFAHDLTDIYGPNLNPHGYWSTINNIPAITQLEDGWAHFEYDNTEGTGTATNDRT